MKKYLSYGFVFLLGLVVAFLYFQKSKSNIGSSQIAIINNGIKNVSKLVVTEVSYSEVYSYNDVDKYFFETLDFEKKLTLLVKAKVLVSYDLKTLEIEVDSLHKKLIIKHIPEAVLTSIPDVKYYDFQQSMLNTFSKDELNTIQQKALDKLMENVEVSSIKVKARKRLIVELKQLMNLTEILGWTVEDQTQNRIFLNELKPLFKD